MKKVREDKCLIQTLLFSFVAALITFGYFILKGNGFFIVVDDFNVQQLPFATAVWNMFHSGDMGEWSWNIDLGSSFINTFTFYDLGSPFIWLSLLFPRGSFPYIAGFLYVLKYVVAAVTAYLYLKLFVDNRQWAVIGALLYAFSGYQTINLEFFHFHDVVALFPLLLLSLELAMNENKYRPFFVFSVFINCLLNYFFFIGEVVFLVIYYIFRYGNLTPKKFLTKGIGCLICGALGVGMAAVLFIPNVIYVLGNTRGQNKLYLESLCYGTSSLLHVIKGLLFPGDSMNHLSAVIYQNWDSASAYVPLFGLSLVIAYLLKQKKSWLSRLIITLIFISMFPLLNSVFLLFTSPYYRWWYMLVLAMTVPTIIVLDKKEDYPIAKASLIYAGILVGFYLVIRFVKWNANGDSIVFDKNHFLLLFAIAVLGPIIVWLLKKHDCLSYRPILALTMLCCVLTTAITLHSYRVFSGSVEGYKQSYEAGLQIKSIDDQYRYNSVDNVLMINSGAGGIGVFCTTVENSSRYFDTLFGHYPSNNTTQTKYDVPGLAELLSGKYEITGDPGDKEVIYSVSSGESTLYVTEKEACPIGFAVDYYLTEAEFMEIAQEQKAITLMKAAIVDEADIDDVSNAASHYEANSIDYQKSLESFVESTVENRVLNFKRDSHGFECSTVYDEERLVYFTVPWSEGWSATIDGEKADVLNSGGLMAVCVPSGNHQVEFSYNTPGLKAGSTITIISCVLFLLFVLAEYKKRRVLINREDR